MIGDSLMASTARRYGGELCTAVVPDGWDVEVDAETGRFIDFGERVLDRRLDDDFDAAVVMLGNNYGANPDVFRDGLEQIVDDLAPRPTILLHRHPVPSPTGTTSTTSSTTSRWPTTTCG